MVLYLPKSAQTMLEAMKSVNRSRQLWKDQAPATNAINDKYLHAKDDLRVPKIALHVTGDLASECVGDITYSGEARPWRITQAVTSVQLNVDAKGVRIQARAVVGAEPFGSPPPAPTPRQFYFDRPFFLFLWRDAAEWPYAGVWVGDITALEK